VTGRQRLTSICGVVLAAGEGRRLRPLTAVRPKALCPVGNVPLLDRALRRLAAVGLSGPEQVAVNACHLADQVVAHVGDRAHLSVEVGSPLGTAGGLGNLRSWIAGRGVLVGNADAYLAVTLAAPGSDADTASTAQVADLADLAALLDGWDGRTVRILGVPTPPGRAAEFDQHLFAGFSLLPWSDVAALTPEPSSLVLTTWRPAEREGRLEVVEYQGTYLDTGTPTDYLAANLHAANAEASGSSRAADDGPAAGSLIATDALIEAPVEHSVIGSGAQVLGPVTRAVVWPGGRVGGHECLLDAIRVGDDLTVQVDPGS
jgi:MurNAc alpha-1-phosphate uridylyltransferase